MNLNRRIIALSLVAGIIYSTVFTLNRIIFPSYFQYLQHLISFIFTLTLSFLYLRFKKSSAIDYTIVALVLLFSFNLLTTLSMNIDRSRSVQVIFMAEEAERNNVNLRYALRSHSVGSGDFSAYIQRFAEQSEMGFLSGDLEKPKVTVLGRIFIFVSSFLARIWNLDSFLISQGK